MDVQIAVAIAPPLTQRGRHSKLFVLYLPKANIVRTFFTRQKSELCNFNRVN
jgi:hypothetical protein